MVALIRHALFAGTLGSLMVPLVCTASGAREADAVRNCAQAEAQHLNAALAGTRVELPLSMGGHDTDRSSDQLVVVALDHKGREVAQMLCTYDHDGRVLSLRPAASSELAFDLEH